ncbi:MAG: hypothetical protein ACRD4J_05005 [Nitrososphaeraceae archaeon]|jgi:hypothetical protein
MARSSDDRIDKLESLGQILDDNNRRDKASMMSQLSQEFDRHMQIAEKFTKDNDLGGAEAHRLIAESIHGTLSTFEVIKE